MSTPEPTDAEAVWRVLAEECGARADMPDDFAYHWPCSEYRFQGALGFGGKVYAERDGVRVGCYCEDDTPDRRRMIDAANARFASDGRP